MTRTTLGALIAAVVVLAAGVVTEAQGPIRIGASLSLTGTYAKLGKNQHEGYQLCQKDLNARGGVLGRKVEFVVYDDQSMPPTGVRLYENSSPRTRSTPSWARTPRPSRRPWPTSPRSTRT
jgi:branched-chain amino acid transport system substrate-binding protein